MGGGRCGVRDGDDEGEDEHVGDGNDEGEIRL